MRLFFASILALCLTFSATLAQNGPSEAIQSTISNQIEAFQADDFATAFGFAAPNIQSMFRSAENFGAMVRNGYPMVWRPEDVRFGALRQDQGAFWQRVIVQDGQGRSHALDYRMVQIDGAWKISGVQRVPMPDVAA